MPWVFLRSPSGTSVLQFLWPWQMQLHSWCHLHWGAARFVFLQKSLHSFSRYFQTRSKKTQPHHGSLSGMAHVCAQENNCIPYPGRFWEYNPNPASTLSLFLHLNKSLLSLSLLPEGRSQALDAAFSGMTKAPELCLPTVKEQLQCSPVAPPPLPWREREVAALSKGISFLILFLSHSLWPFSVYLTLMRSKSEGTWALSLENLHLGVCCHFHFWSYCLSYWGLRWTSGKKKPIPTSCYIPLT